MKRGNQIQIVAYVSPKQKMELAKVSERTHIPQAALIRLGVDLVLAKYKKVQR